jgi:phosphocarrier protein
MIVTNKAGIHARPSSLIVKTATKFDSKIILTKGKHVANAKSIMEVMTLAAACGEVLELKTDGLDEILAANAIEELFKTNFSKCYK